MTSRRQPRDPELVKRAKALRKSATPSEVHLWRFLRCYGLQGIKFRRQHPIEPYIVDFYCASKNLIIEVDGTIHDILEVTLKDKQREIWLEERGYTVIRFTASEVEHDVWDVLARIAEMIGQSLDRDAVTFPKGDLK